jgi:hypothetical protein
VAVGFGSMFSNSTGYSNTAIGVGSLAFTTTGSSNTASGEDSLNSNTTGSSNTASGSYSLNSNTTGSANIALGNAAGYNLTTGSNNIDIGNQGVVAESNTIRIGDSNQSKAFIAGISGVTVTGAAVLVSSSGQLGVASSSMRLKQDVADMGKASNRLMELRPVTFHYKSQPDGPLQYGLIAEEVNDVMPELVIRDATGQIETVAYHELPALLLNELQKQQAEIAKLRAELAARDAEDAQIKALVERVAALERQVRQGAQGPVVAAADR